MKKYPSPRIQIAVHVILAIVQLSAISVRAAPNSNVDDLGSSDKTARRKAKDTLISGGANSIPALIHGLDSSNQTVKIQALTILDEIKVKVKTLADDQIADSIARKAPGESDAVTRAHMVHTLGGLKGPSATRELKRFARQDPDMYIRADATENINDVSGADESSFFQSQWKDPHEIVRLSAYLALAKYGDKSGRGVALQVLERSPIKRRPPADVELIREKAIAILGYVANPADIQRLKMISESDAESRRCQTSAFYSYHRAQLLQRPAEQRLDVLIKALDDPLPGVRVWAYGELYSSKDPNTSTRLKKYLKEPGHLGYKEAADALDSR